VEKLIITVSPTGGMHGKEKNPNLPEQPDEIVEQVYECYQAGASIVHLHTRDKDGKPRQLPEVYTELKRRIREKCDIIIAASTGTGATSEEQISSLESNPEIASLNMGTLLIGERMYGLTRSQLEHFAGVMLGRGIKPEMEIYHTGMFIEVVNLIEKGLIKAPYFINLLLGFPSGMPAGIENFLNMRNNAPGDNVVFNTIGIGRSQLLINFLGIMTGCHVRVGMEDNVYYARGQLAKSNAEFVRRIADVSKEYGREIASPSEAREVLGLPQLEK
jgi:3-keto-5-aminohexanoate cleavage enzyme